MKLKAEFEIDLSLPSSSGKEASLEYHSEYLKTLLSKAYIKAYDDFIKSSKEGKIFKDINKLYSEECDQIKIILDNIKIKESDG